MPSSGTDPSMGVRIRRMSPPKIWRTISRNAIASPKVMMSP